MGKFITFPCIVTAIERKQKTLGIWVLFSQKQHMLVCWISVKSPGKPSWASCCGLSSSGPWGWIARRTYSLPTWCFSLGDSFTLSFFFFCKHQTFDNLIPPFSPVVWMAVHETVFWNSYYFSVANQSLRTVFWCQFETSDYSGASSVPLFNSFTRILVVSKVVLYPSLSA